MGGAPAVFQNGGGNRSITAPPANTLEGRRLSSNPGFFQVTHRYLIFDEEAGIAWGICPFFQTDVALVVGEVFEIIDGKSVMIQAVMAYMPTKAWN